MPHDKELKFSDILERSTYDQVLTHIIDKEVLAATYNSREKVIKYFDKKLGLKWPSSEVETNIEASLLRNCIIHNNSRVDSRLAKIGRWSVDDTIELTTAEVHVLGLSARAVARSLFDQAGKKFFTKEAAS